MLKKRSYSWLPTLLSLFILLLGTSCNRGYGCPTNFSLSDVLNIFQELRNFF